jgi:hypothetical protein
VARRTCAWKVGRRQQRTLTRVQQVAPVLKRHSDWLQQELLAGGGRYTTCASGLTIGHRLRGTSRNAVWPDDWGRQTEAE